MHKMTGRWALLGLGLSLAGAGIVSGNVRPGRDHDVLLTVFGVAAGLHLAVLLILFFLRLLRDSPRVGPIKGQAKPAQAKATGRSGFVPPKPSAAGTFDVRVPAGADVASFVARFAADLGMEAYQSATAGFILKDAQRRKVYRANVIRTVAANA